MARAGLVKGADDLEGIEAILLPMARSIAEHWQPLKTWTWINTSIGRWAGYLMVLAASPSVFIVASLYLDMAAERKQNARLYNRLPASKEKEVLEAAAQTSKGNLRTGRLVQAKYYEVSGKNIDPKALLGTLREATDTNLIASDIASKEDEPVLTWRRKL